MKSATLPAGVLTKVGHTAEQSEFASFYRAYNSLVRAVVFQIAGPANLDDLVQDAFVKIWKGLSGFRDEAKVSSWVYRIAANVAIGSLRTLARRREDLGFDFSVLPDTRKNIEEVVQSREIVQAGLESLSHEQRAVLVLAYIHDRPLAEIAEVVGVPLGTVKSRLHYAKEAFSNFLASNGVSP